MSLCQPSFTHDGLTGELRDASRLALPLSLQLCLSMPDSDFLFLFLFVRQDFCVALAILLS